MLEMIIVIFWILFVLGAFAWLLYHGGTSIFKIILVVVGVLESE